MKLRFATMVVCAASIGTALAAAEERVVVLPAVTYLHGGGKDRSNGVRSKQQGPGKVSFADAKAFDTSASFSAAGDYVLQLQYTHRGQPATDTLRVKVEEPPSQAKLNAVYVTRTIA